MRAPRCQYKVVKKADGSLKVRPRLGKSKKVSCQIRGKVYKRLTKMHGDHRGIVSHVMMIHKRRQANPPMRKRMASPPKPRRSARLSRM